MDNVYVVVEDSLQKLLDYLHSNKHICENYVNDEEFRIKFKELIKDNKESEQTEDDMSEFDFYLQNPINRKRHNSFRVFNPLLFLAKEIRKH